MKEQQQQEVANRLARIEELLRDLRKLDDAAPAHMEYLNPDLYLARLSSKAISGWYRGA